MTEDHPKTLTVVADGALFPVTSNGTSRLSDAALLAGLDQLLVESHTDR